MFSATVYIESDRRIEKLSASFETKSDRDNYLIDKAVSSYYSEQKKNVQEAIIQMSDSNNFKQLCDKIGYDKAIKQHIEFLTKVYYDWQRNNPSLKIFSAVIHCDEATPHMHIDFVPTAETPARKETDQTAFRSALQTPATASDTHGANGYVRSLP